MDSFADHCGRYLESWPHARTRIAPLNFGWQFFQEPIVSFGRRKSQRDADKGDACRLGGRPHHRAADKVIE
jgi:hypothetical protein